MAGFEVTPEDQGLLESIALFERALEGDHKFALAWAGLADACSTLADYGLAQPGEWIARARDAAEHAITLDAGLAEPHTSLAFIRGLYDWEWAESERLYKHSIQLNPGCAATYHWYGVDCLALLGRFEEAMEMVKVAVQLRPLQPILRKSIGHINMLARRFDTAEVIFRQLQTDFPEFSRAYTALRLLDVYLYRAAAMTMRYRYSKKDVQLRETCRL